MNNSKKKQFISLEHFSTKNNHIVIYNIEIH